MKLLVTIFLMLPLIASAQKTGDKKVIITVKDTSSLYLQVKYALGKSNFIVREDGNKDTLITFPADLNGIQGKAAIKAIIRGNIVELSGAYGLKQMDNWGYTHSPKNYKPIIYFKGGKTWKLLLEIANKIGYSNIVFER